MKTLEQQIAFYAAYHRDRWNKLAHFIGGWALQLAGHVFESCKL